MRSHVPLHPLGRGRRVFLAESAGICINSYERQHCKGASENGNRCKAGDNLPMINLKKRRLFAGFFWFVYH